jgi:invasion protein IalB
VSIPLPASWVEQDRVGNLLKHPGRTDATDGAEEGLMANAAVTALCVTTLFIAGPLSPALAQLAPKPAAPARPAPAKPPAAPAQPAPVPQAQAVAPGPAPQLPQFIYSPWAKLCSKGQDAQAKLLCITRKEARTEAGQPVMAAALIEPEGEPKKLFRVTVPNQLQIQPGTRVIVDQQPPVSGPFFACFADGCMADYEATPDLIGKLKHGQMLTIQAINLAGAMMNFPLPLVDFAKVNEGPPTDPTVFEEQQKKLQDEIQKRTNEARNKPEGQAGAFSGSLRPTLPIR